MQENLISSMDAKWLEGEGPCSDVVVSSRIRLARNLKDLPFPHLMNDDNRAELFQRAKNSINSIGSVKDLGELIFFELKDISKLERKILVEKHLISLEHAENANGAVIFSQDQSISIMVKEEDHLRIQSILPALKFDEGLTLVNYIDDLLEKNMDYAFHEKYGYLTSCPTNVGTGMRASAMMHLPGLVLGKQVNRVLMVLSQMGLVVRGIYGEGTEPLGNLFQVSNGATMGRSEEEVISHLQSVVKQIIEQERLAREKLYNSSRERLEDRVFRAEGILKSSRLMSSEEALNLLSDLKMGVDLGIINSVSKKIYYQLLVAIQPAFLQFSANNKEMTSINRDEKRSEVIRKLLHEEG